MKDGWLLFDYQLLFYYMKKLLLIAAVFVVFGGAFLISKVNNGGNKTGSPLPSPGAALSPTLAPRVRSSQQNPPLPLDSRLIVDFINLVSERKISEAVMMMSGDITGDDNAKQAWGVQLNAIKSVKITKLEAYMIKDWKDTEHTYKVELDISMDPASSDAPIPYYGYEEGSNIRWISLVKENEGWKIKGIATGP